MRYSRPTAGNLHLYVRENMRERYKNHKAIYWEAYKNSKEQPIDRFVEMHRTHGWTKPILYAPYCILSGLENLWVIPHECDSGYAHGAVGPADFDATCS